MSFEDTTPTGQPAAAPQPGEAPTERLGQEPGAQVWGAAPQQQRPRWNGRKTAIAVAVAVVIAGGGGAAIAAAAGNSSSSGNGPGGGNFPGGMGGYGQQMMGGGGGSGFALLGSALHGDFVVSNGSGYATERMQRGKVTAFSSTSVTVASDDGYTSTYVLNSSTDLENDNQKVTSIPTGQTVTVLATLSGTGNATATATSVEEGTTSMRGNGGSGTGGPGGSGGSGGPGDGGNFAPPGGN